MNIKKAHAVTWIALGALLLAELSFACGSMGLGTNRGQAFTSIGLILFLPMIILIPVEWLILKEYGELGEKTTRAYAACLFAKPVAVAAVYFFAAKMGQIKGVIAAELIYSLVHFAVSLSILKFEFKNDGRNFIQTAAIISTFIPWSYSIGVPLTYFLVAAFNQAIG